ncbi:MAG: HAD-IA family hydrolase, partial [Alphaproteobacteria bacterium]|nr:HAD-IA family hydrolase [Alphaproteobacteria bacterium]
DVPVKPHPQIVFDILSEAGVTASETLYVGDTGIDMQTARNAGVESIGVLWGFRTERELIENGAVHIISKPSEILNFISK